AVGGPRQVEPRTPSPPRNAPCRSAGIPKTPSPTPPLRGRRPGRAAPTGGRPAMHRHQHYEQDHRQDHRKGRRRRAGRPLRAVAPGAAVLLAAAGCSSGGSGEAAGGTAVIALIQEPGVLSPMFSSQSGSELTEAFVVEPMFLTRPDGEQEPYLAEEVPTEENGGVSEDGLTVTYTLREGVTWSDGEPLTAEDLAFTVDVAQDPDGAALPEDRKSTRLNSSHVQISYAVFCLNKQK